MEVCLFFSQPEPTPGYKPGKNIEFTCSRCVQLLLRADQDDLKRAYAKAIKHGYENKAKAASFYGTEMYDAVEAAVSKDAAFLINDAIQRATDHIILKGRRPLPGRMHE